MAFDNTLIQGNFYVSHFFIQLSVKYFVLGFKLTTFIKQQS